MELARIQYMGEDGATDECKDAILRLLQYRDKIMKAEIVTHSTNHGFLLTVNEGILVAIKSGFSSGYGGTGPRGLSYILKVLESHAAIIKECEVSQDLLDRLDQSALTEDDIDTIEKSRLLGPSKWSDYIFQDDWDLKKDGRLWREFPLVIPYAIVDRRLVDLALSFWDNPDEKLLTGYRQLEDIIRDRTGLKEHGTKLFQALRTKISWENIDEGEKSGRINLFIGAYMAYRNPRAHRKLDDNSQKQLNEFLLLNHLYVLEAELVDVVSVQSLDSSQKTN
jgi:hypothetical protein